MFFYNNKLYVWPLISFFYLMEPTFQVENFDNKPYDQYTD